MPSIAQRHPIATLGKHSTAIEALRGQRLEG